jgi:hypothetical protein
MGACNEGGSRPVAADSIKGGWYLQRRLHLIWSERRLVKAADKRGDRPTRVVQRGRGYRVAPATSGNRHHAARAGSFV